MAPTHNLLLWACGTPSFSAVQTNNSMIEAAVKALRSSPSGIWSERGFGAAVFGGIVRIHKGYSLESIPWLPAQPTR